jgi:hypothetical protein
MTQVPPLPPPPIPLPPAAAPVLIPAKLRPVEHPDLSPALTHFCSRGRPLNSSVPPDIAAMSAQRRLEEILWSGTIKAFVTYSQGDPAVCMTETKKAGLDFLIRDRYYEPWALIFQRQNVYDAGGGPVWYARPEEYSTLGRVDPKLRSWAVRLDPGSDWLEEREWRVPRPMAPFGGAPSIPLAELGLVGLIVGDLGWTAGRYLATGTSDGRPPGIYLPAAIQGLPRFLWNPTTRQLDLYGPVA